jgi:hypothetical protein
MRKLLLAAAVTAAAVAGAAQLASSGPPADRPIVVAVRGDLDTTLAPRNLTALLTLERRLRALPDVRRVTGPASFVDRAATKVAAAARQDARLGLRYGFSGVPSLTNSDFVLQLVKGTSLRPKKRFAALFPSNDLARIVVRPRPGLDAAQMQALGDEVARLATATRLAGVRATA